MPTLHTIAIRVGNPKKWVTHSTHRISCWASCISPTHALPKTRSGKIMRRILRKIAANEVDSIGDTSTLADPAVVDDLLHNRANK